MAFFTHSNSFASKWLLGFPPSGYEISGLAQNAAVMIHRRLVGMPDDLAGLCKLRVGDWRIIYWIYRAEKIVRIYRIQHRSEVYRHL
jgi:hypothetical protein